MPQASHPTTDLRAAMRGVRAFLLDLDGVIVTAGTAVPRAADAIAELERRSVPYRIVTNTSAVSRATLVTVVVQARCADPGGTVRIGAVRLGSLDGADIS